MLLSYPQHGDACPALSPHEQEVVGAMIKIAVASENPGSALWRNFSPFFTPLAIQFQNKKTLLINHPNPPAGYSPLTATCPGIVKGKYSQSIFLGTENKHFPQTLNHATINRSQVFAILDEGHSTPADFTAFAVHEIFHLFQNKTFQFRETPVSDSITPDSLAGEYKERLALGRALYSKTPVWEAEFVSLRNTRYKNQDRGLTSLQDKEELTEGTASYVGLRALAILRQDTTAPGELFTDLVAAKLFPKIIPYSKRPFYGTGAALCLLLDRRGKDWQKAIEGGAAPFEVFSAIAERIEKKRRYFAPFTGLAKDQISWSEAKKKELLAEFYNSHNVRLIVEFQSKSEVSGSGKGSVNISYPVGTNRTLVYPDYLEFSKEPEFKLTVQKSLFLLSHSAKADKDNYRLYSYETPVFRPTNIEITIDGKVAGLDAGTKYFHKITFNSGNISLTLNAKGKFANLGNVFTITSGKID